MNTIFMNSENSKTSEPLNWIIRFTDKLDLRKGAKVLPYEILVVITRGKT